MEQLTSHLPGVAVYIDHILVSGKSAEDYLHYLRGMLKRLNDKGLRCRFENVRLPSHKPRIWDTRYPEKA